MSDSRFEYVGGARKNPSPKAIFDVVFVHGLTGDYRETWTHKNGTFWPRWLADDFSSLNVYSAGYDSSIFLNFLKGDGASLADRATMLLDRLLSRKAPNRPILFITHSLGGLIVKQMLRKSHDASNVRRKRLCKNLAGVVFIATPHQGAQFAKSVNSVLQILTSKSVKELSHGADSLIDLGQWFSNWASEASVKIECYYEVEKHKGILVVDQMTANPNVLGCDPVAVQADHVSITKLEDRNAQLYQSLFAIIEEIASQSCPGAGSASSGGGQIENEFDTYTTHAAGDRRTLAQKLRGAHREHEITRAERQKERFSMTLQRSIAQPAAVRRYTRLMANIETRFHRYVVPAIAAGRDAEAIDALVQENVLDPCLKAHDADGDDSTPAVVDSAYYYLAGNCHIGWDHG
ncbi:ABC-three component system protein [Mesorhizobium sp.]|uniref:ABC-three component system protein n=1 Tax=Mesorhizobium sp. TaxID=1871066 RepID=UPI0025F56167|nr:ABC-three component system protein [Mesorhizobium sp.]